MMNGIGNMLYNSKDEYIGTWKNGKKDGKGIYKWSDGCIYAGEFKGGKMEGYGICYNSKGEVLYEGEWKNNLIHGKGTYIWEKGKKYIGEFMHGKKHGQGTFYLNNELVYEGTWKFDKPSIFDRTLDEIFSLRL
ncbi:MORN repeat-containing protein [Clostridioides difficile]|nr:MORN repeat-containing protein [Clostridioides difficile]